MGVACAGYAQSRRLQGQYRKSEFCDDRGLAAARLRHIAGTAWSTKGYLNTELLKDQQMGGAITA
jgi:hypothetical protein